jgi:hypothetical protein
MAIFGNQPVNVTDSFNVAGNMKELAIQQDNQGKIMSDTINKFVAARDEMGQLQAQTGAILSNYAVDESGKPDPSAPKYVHDLYNSINKEGGIANLSRSQMVAGLQYYDTGTKVEQQRNALDLERLKVNQIKKAMRDQDETEKALAEVERAKREGRFNTTKTAIQKKEKFVKIGGETIQLDTQEFSNDFSALDEAQKKNDQKSILEISDRIAKKIYSKTSKSQREIETPVGAADDSGEKFEGYKTVANPDFQEYVSPYISPSEVDVSTPELKQEYLRKKEIADKEVQKYNNFINTGLNQFRQDRLNAQNKGALESMSDADKEIKRLEEQKAAIEKQAEGSTDASLAGLVGVGATKAARGADYATVNAAAIRAILRGQKMIGVKEKDITQDYINELVSATRNNPALGISGNIKAVIDGVITSLTGDNITGRHKKMIDKAIAESESRIDANTNYGIQTPAGKIAGIEDRINYLKSQKSITQSKIGQTTPKEGYNWSGKPIEYTERGQDEYVRREEEVTVELQKTMDEQLNDQFELARNWMMQTNGRVPPSFTKQSYAASQGIVMPTVMDTGNGYSYIKIGGVEKLVKNEATGQQNLMSITDQQRLSDAANLGKAKDLNGLTANGFSFTGEINVNDINMANKVRTELLTNTRALQDVDRLINIAENSTALEKALPAELTGYAQQIQNSIQAAKRTEVGGSGAWSEQDQQRIDRIITDPTSLRNIVFRDQCLGALKGFRERLTASLKDQGTAYGFKFTLGNVRDQSMSSFKAAVSAFMARGYSAQQARQAAMPYLNGNTQ